MVNGNNYDTGVIGKELAMRTERRGEVKYSFIK